MTLTNTTNRVQYSGDGSTTSFAVSFVFWDLDDPQLVHADADGVETTWVRGTHFTMAGGDGATGTVTVITSPTDYTPASSTTLTITSNLANTQPTSLPAGGALPSGSLEQQLDQIVRQLQQFAETVGRSITLKISSTETDVTIEDLDGQTGKFAQVNAGETGFTFASVTSAGTITDPVPLANGGTGSTTAATALTALGAAGTGIINSFTKAQRYAKAADIASASPLVLGTDGFYWDVTGSTGFSQITCAANSFFVLQFDGALTMSDGANLDLGGASITTAAGDRGLFFAVAANTAQLIGWIEEGLGPYRAATVAASDTVAGSIEIAVQSEMETASSTTLAVTPGRVCFNPGVTKIWAYVDRSAGTPSLSSPSHNMTSVTDDGAAQTIVTIATDFSSAVYAVGASTPGNTAYQATPTTLAAGSFKVKVQQEAGTAGDTLDFSCWALGDQ